MERCKNKVFVSLKFFVSLLRSGLLNLQNTPQYYLLIQSKSMLSELIRSGLLKDKHDRNESAGMLSDLLRSGLPIDKLHHNTIY